ncbi:Leucine-rich repeat-containing protein [Artemisia annua]|uniref:Leucine-rich repeat-containing protein n=1 Tax=Artemisia annua TaxID=35608 RepID=A0A2U1KRF3_ARTAN|nr:Leucine-rich repeat-containing protein [Artemisia annua]
MKLRYCCNLTTTPDFSEITNLEELSLEGCVNLVSIHPSIGMLKRLVVLNLAGCLKVEQHPSFVSSLINLESLSFGGQWKIQPRWWTSITAPFKLLQSQHPQRSVSLAGLHMLKELNLSYCNLEQVPESIGGLSCLKFLYLAGNNFTSLPGSFSQLSYLAELKLNGCKKLEVLPELPPSLYGIEASDCTSLREVLGSSMNINFFNCPKLFKNVTIDSEGCISKTECLDSSITSQGSIHQLSAFLGYAGIQTKRCEFFLQDTKFNYLDIVYHGNSMPEWFTNRSRENHVKVELPSDWCYDKFRGFGTCVVFKCKKPFSTFKGYYSVNNFDGASLDPNRYITLLIDYYFEKEVIGIQDSYMIWLRYRRDTRRWEEAKNFVTFCFQENNEDVEVKQCGVRLICDEDIEQEADLSMLQGLPTPTQNGGMLGLSGPGAGASLYWSW